MFAFDERTRALLAAIRARGSIAAAARSLGMDPSNARRHLATAAARAGSPLLRAERGGVARGRAVLTAAGLRLAGGRSGVRARALAYDEARGLTPLEVGARTIFVAGRVEEGPVLASFAPEHVVLARAAPTASARNAIDAQVVEVVDEREGVHRVRLVAGPMRFDALVTREALRELRIRSGSRLVASVKATAIAVERL